MPSPPLEHPEQIAEFMGGRQSLRLVKIRLALALIAVAVLSVAAVAPLIRSLSASPTTPIVPVPASITLAGLLLLIGGGIWWMGRQIVAPAAALEAQRAQFERLYQSAREAALIDGLTGLGNHRAFQEALARLVDSAQRYGRPFGLILFDIDEFKRINDTHGHAVGDELLVEVGLIIRATIRTADSGYRIGGDEFAVLTPETDLGGTAITARRLLARGLEDRGAGHFRMPISFSAGVTACPQFGTSRLELTAEADAALYRGKRAGRTCVTVFDPLVDKGHLNDGMRAEISASISTIIEGRTLSPVYQPIIHLPTGRILGYEGLVRLAPGSGFAHTGALFEGAEVAGRVLDLDLAALEVVLTGARAMPPETLLSLNISPRSFEAPEFNAKTLLNILRRHGADPEHVLIELTEREAVRDADGLRESIRTLRDAGVRIAADDVGAGNAGLRLLSQFHFDVVKIDLSLVQGGANGEQMFSVMASLVDLARRWGALTIAEGVETPDQLRMIRALGVDSAQGYLLGRPGRALDATEVDLDALTGTSDTGETAALPAWARPRADRVDRRAGAPTGTLISPG